VSDIDATSAGTHGAIVHAALDAGMQVYCEKPITPTEEEGDALAQHAHESHRVLQVGFQFRFHPGDVVLRETFADLGPLPRVYVSATNWFRP
jgi:virulence factor